MNASGLHRVIRTVALSLMTFSAAAAATPLQGQSSEEFQITVNRWLDGNDSESLTKLSQIAQDGNIAAQLLLARIERTQRAPSKFLLSLSPQDRKQVFRSPQIRGAFNLTWLQVLESSGLELAICLQRANGTGVDLKTIEKLRELNEAQATDHLIRTSALYGNPTQKKRLLEDLALPELRPFVRSQMPPERAYADGVFALEYASAFSDSPVLPAAYSQRDGAVDAARFMALGIPFGKVTQGNYFFEIVTAWINRDVSLEPIRNACALLCPLEMDSCGVTLVGLTGGYYEIIRNDSPLESVIPQSVYLASPRARDQVLRRALLTRAEYGGELASTENIRQFSPCLADEAARIRSEAIYSSW
ncbi:MAG: hypothetical protein AAF402_11360 [Pseudomonadota bacterium]